MLSTHFTAGASGLLTAEMLGILAALEEFGMIPRIFSTDSAAARGRRQFWGKRGDFEALGTCTLL